MTSPQSTVEYILGQIQTQLEEMGKKIEHVTGDHADRLSSIELWKTRVVAYGTVIGFIWSIAFALFMKFFVLK